MNFTSLHAAPQLLQFVGREMQAMADEPNDMWAVGTVLFQLLMSGHLPWERQFGPYMFGPSLQDMVEGDKLPDGRELVAFICSKIRPQQELWVRLSGLPSTAIAGL